MQDPKTTVTTNSILEQPYVEPATSFRAGFVPSAEIWNGRLAMFGFLAAALTEVFTGQGFLHFWGLVQNVATTTTLP
ncbi:MAG: chlorophyll a/b-binding protein [Phormidesmis sp.]